MKTVTDAKFRENLGDMLEYIRTGGTLVIIGEDKEETVLSGLDLTPEQRAALDGVKKARDKMSVIQQHPLAHAIRALEKRHPVLFSQGRKALSFEEAMRYTREKHAETIKRLEDN